MRLLPLLGAVLLLGGAAPAAVAQGDGAAAATRVPDRGDSALVARALALREATPWVRVPEPPAAGGGLVVPADSVVAGDVVTRGGDLELFGTVTGDAIAYAGDVIVHPGARVDGRAVAVLGAVRLEDGGRVGGELVSLRGTASAVAAAPPLTTWDRTLRALLLVLGWLAVVLPIGVGVLALSRGPLDGVVETLESSVGKSLAVGLLGQLAIVPALLLLIVGLAVTLIGIILLPFAIPAFVVAVAGLLMLGFLAAARMTGGALAGRSIRGADDEAERRRSVRALLVGVLVLFTPWLVAALLAGSPLAAGIARGVALALTWVAVTAGFGAALLSRAGRRRRAPERTELPDLSWQTPTPVGGVVAAQRPVSTAGARGSS